jgi:formate hydrogenlyase transcriptional activator
MVIGPHGDRTANAHADDRIIGNSAALRQLMDQVELVAPTDSTVLILGETGTGKELIARHIHRSSSRSGRPFVKLNCAAVPVTLFESELFGHEKGAFTDAIAQKVGRLELAHGGTLFLDEVGEIPLELQAKLLRVLQEREFERLGSTQTIHVDVRLIAATNRDLAAMVSERHFRSDLYYRLNVFPVVVPPLRERAGDIPKLVHHFMGTLATRMNKRVDRVPGSAMAALSRYQWPGNIRELEHVIERAVILSRGTELEVPIAELRLLTESAAAALRLTTLEELEREHIRRVLEQTHWLIGGSSGAAAILGLKRTTLQSKMIRFGIERPDRRPRQRDERLSAA